MIEVGHIFTRDNIKFCVVDILDYNSKKYGLVSVENNTGLKFDFYEITQNDDGCKLNKVYDDELILDLMELVEEEK